MRSNRNNTSVFIMKEKISFYLGNFIPPHSDMKTQSPQFGIRTGHSWATHLHRAGPTPLEYQSVNARFWHPEIQEVNRDGPSRPIILGKGIKRKRDIPFQIRSRARDKEKKLAHLNVFDSKAPNEPVLDRTSFVRGIPLSGLSGIKIFA